MTQTNFGKKWSEEEKNKLKQLYSRKQNIELAKIFGRTKKGIEKQAKKLKLKKDEQWRNMLNGRNRRVRNFNTRFFETINTPNKAYVLGFIYADGYLYEPRGSLQIGLSSKDHEHLVNISRLIGADPEKCINRSFRKSILPNGEEVNTESSYLNVHSLNMMKDLLNLGISQKKSLIIKFPTTDQVPEEFWCDFIRGVFDGDGYYNLKNKKIINGLGFTDGSKGFLSSIGKILHEKAGVFSKREKLRSGRESTYDLRYGDYRDIINISNYMYQNYSNNTSTITLQRKHSLYQKLLSQPKVKSQFRWTENNKEIMRRLYPIYPTTHLLVYFPDKTRQSLNDYARKTLKLSKSYGVNQNRSLPINKLEMDELIKDLL